MSQQKQLTGGDGVRVETVAKLPYEFVATQMPKMPLPPNWGTNPLHETLTGNDEAVVETLDSTEVATSEAAMGECLARAGNLQGVIDSTNWEVFDAIKQLSDDRKSQAAEIHSSIAETLRCDEHVMMLGATLKEAQSKAFRLLTTRVDPKPPEPGCGPVPPPLPGRRVVDEGSREFQTVEDARRTLQKIGEHLSNGRTLSLRIIWRVEEEKGSGW